MEARLIVAQVVILNGANQRKLAKSLIDLAPDGAIVTMKKKSRSNEANAKMWAMLSDVSRAKPEGRNWTPDTWKAAFMHSLGHQILFCEGLDDSGPFPVGFRSSQLSVREMADLITVIYEYGNRHGVLWSEPVIPEDAA